LALLDGLCAATPSISRNYDPGDEVSIVGFSRGAYTARALADMIACKGLLSKRLAIDKEKAYDSGIKAWFRYWAEIRMHPYVSDSMNTRFIPLVHYNEFPEG